MQSFAESKCLGISKIVWVWQQVYRLLIALSKRTCLQRQTLRVATGIPIAENASNLCTLRGGEMHPTAMANGKRFFDSYLPSDAPVTVVDLGAQDVNGSLKEVCPSSARYVGVDFVAGKGVDIVLDDPYLLPFDDASVDVVVSSSCFEHSEMFWILYLEILRILKPTGLFYLNCPANGEFHRYPVDCWRFYPDCGRGLITWAKRNGINAGLLESYTSNADRDQWRDFVSVFVKDVQHASRYKKRILDTFSDFSNGLTDENLESFRNFKQRPELLTQAQPAQRNWFRRLLGSPPIAK